MGAELPLDWSWDDDPITIFKNIVRGIHTQNLALIERVKEKDFNPGIELDNTKNNAGYRLSDFFAALKLFPHGEAPARFADELLDSTDELIDVIRGKYGNSKDIAKSIIRVRQAFGNSKRIWRIKKPPVPLSKEEYSAALDQCLAEILKSLDDLNYELSLLPYDFVIAANAPRPRQIRRGRIGSGLKGKRTAAMEQWLQKFVNFINNGHAIDENMKEKTVGARAAMFWLLNKKSVLAASKASGEKRGFSSAKTLATAYRNSK